MELLEEACNDLEAIHLATIEQDSRQKAAFYRDIQQLVIYVKTFMEDTLDNVFSHVNLRPMLNNESIENYRNQLPIPTTNCQFQLRSFQPHQPTMTLSQKNRQTKFYQRGTIRFTKKSPSLDLVLHPWPLWFSSRLSDCCLFFFIQSYLKFQ